MSGAAGSTLARMGVPACLHEADEVAVDHARRVALRRRDVEITAVVPGPSAAAATVRKALALGADVGIHVRDARLHGGDGLAISRVLAAVLARVRFDLVLCGSGPADSGWAMVPAMLAERLGVPGLCFADSLRVGERRVEIGRDDGFGPEAFEADLPAVVSVSERCGELRYQRFGAAVAARHKPMLTWSVADLNLDERDLEAATAVLAAAPMPPKPRTVIDGDPATAAVGIAAITSFSSVEPSASRAWPEVGSRYAIG
jgi:electron transfer flavoprotein beta subunit